MTFAAFPRDRLTARVMAYALIERTQVDPHPEARVRRSGPARDVDRLIEAADRNLDRAKSAGRGRAVAAG
ncbi:hypothetical protein [Actinoplanes sp. NPDC049265]|uniref:hypothetical protein n=1 Tax=Actinoplanes sp. NPDC049265 TaxID=3363902 RepID=UPI0037125B17